MLNRKLTYFLTDALLGALLYTLKLSVFNLSLIKIYSSCSLLIFGVHLLSGMAKRFCVVFLLPVISKHKVFTGESKLEILGMKYVVENICCPKYHCE
jgi:hypothetical protein